MVEFGCRIHLVKCINCRNLFFTSGMPLFGFLNFAPVSPYAGFHGYLLTWVIENVSRFPNKLSTMPIVPSGLGRSYRGCKLQ